MVDHMGSGLKFQFLRLSAKQMQYALLSASLFFAFLLICVGAISFWPESFPDWLQQYSLQVFLFVSIIFMWRTGWRPLFRLGGRSILWVVIAILSYLFLLYELDLYFLKTGGAVQPEAFSTGELWHFVLLVFIAPVLEEVFFRDLLYRALCTRLERFVLTALFSSVFFMFAHMSFQVGALILGIVSCLLLVCSRSILASIALHSCANLSLFLLPTWFPQLYHSLNNLKLFNYFY
jgi:membrane protease YdiL (CAAX protease family)